MSEQMVESKPQKGETRRDQPPIAPPPPAGRKIPKFVPMLIVLVLGTAGYFTWKAFFAAPPIPDNIVVLSGRVEGDDSAVAPKTSGRIVEIRFREGDVVNAGDIIATLDDEQIRARENQAQAQVAQAEARLNAAQQQIGILNEQLQQSRIQVTQAGEDAQGRVHQAEAQVAQAEAQLAQQEAAYRIAAYDRDAYTKLAQSGAASERQARQMQSNADAQAALVAAAHKQVDASRGALTAAKANLSNAAIRGSQSAAIQKQLVQEQFDIKSASADAQRARAQLNEAQANRQDLLVRAPFQGTIVTRTAEPGEVVTAGTPIVTLLDMSKVYLRGFVPEGQIGKVKVGQPARVYLDSNPSQAVDASVSRIDPQATFTPENTYFREDRVKQVVGVKLQLKGAVGYAKPGMPADGEILVSGAQWPPRAIAPRHK
jgi:HlyD family secretion protein